MGNHNSIGNGGSEGGMTNFLLVRNAVLNENIFKLPVSYGNHSPHLNTIPLSINYNPSSIFFYVKLNNKFDYPDNLHAVKIKDIRKILDSIDFNHSKFIKPGN